MVQRIINGANMIRTSSTPTVTVTLNDGFSVVRLDGVPVAYLGKREAKVEAAKRRALVAAGYLTVSAQADKIAEDEAAHAARVAAILGA
jgi:uncharacterized Zn-binding protein involved in type VI secretion